MKVYMQSVCLGSVPREQEWGTKGEKLGIGKASSMECDRAGHQCYKGAWSCWGSLRSTAECASDFSSVGGRDGYRWNFLIFGFPHCSNVVPRASISLHFWIIWSESPTGLKVSHIFMSEKPQSGNKRYSSLACWGGALTFLHVSSWKKPIEAWLQEWLQKRWGWWAVKWGATGIWHKPPGIWGFFPLPKAVVPIWLQIMGSSYDLFSCSLGLRIIFDTVKNKVTVSPSASTSAWTRIFH